ncbi:glutathione reductase [Philodulcilactobacillus myokoensis]|uniref:Glutathione reductase n=1 Tax=Philodulcilactobacillus myokoensis TaxID=2929573 RepID=A0A9W6ERQ8_9LACO|nr:NAD(P)/FAD-dependent oxidoreductase [Philodulcilactobacillus myokoensis]GLB46235.1 glutathione reductase [Philodulcilactobacillus myokoensis]
MSKQYDYDVLYLGAGHGTFDGAIPLASKGYHLGVIEADKIGGTCPNWGCNAKIALDAPVRTLHEKQRLNGILNGDLSIDWYKNMQHKHKIIDGLPNAIEGLLKHFKIDVIKGRGSLVDGHTVEVNGKTKSAKNIVIATGLHSNHLDIPGSDLAHDSKDFLALDHMPKNLTIIGSGYISIEFADIANASGANVTVLMHHDKALRQFYQPYVEKTLDALSQRGVKFIKNATPKSFEKDGSQLTVKYNDDKVKTDWILDATGRNPNVKNIGLDKVGVKYDANGIKVDDHLRTSVDSIYASGDVADTDEPKLTPTAQFQSKYLMHLFSGDTKDAIDYPVIPTVVFSSPRLAKFGVSVDEAKQKGYKVVSKNLTGDWYRQIDKEQPAHLTLIFDQDKHLVGATEVSDKADDTIDSLLPAAEYKLSPAQVERMIYLFPSIASDVWANL